MERNRDYRHVCNPGEKIPPDVFKEEVCRACVRPECMHSAYVDTATQKKIQHHEKIGRFVVPEEVPLSPLSEYPEDRVVHRAEVPAVAEDASVLEHSIQELRAKSQDPAPVPPPLPSDPWEVPKDVRYNDYREISDPTKDPWSPEYAGPRELRIKPGESVTMGGKRSHGPAKKAR